jgi:hypothetical protein
MSEERTMSGILFLVFVTALRQVFTFLVQNQTLAFNRQPDMRPSRPATGVRWSR